MGARENVDLRQGSQHHWAESQAYNVQRQSNGGNKSGDAKFRHQLAVGTRIHRGSESAGSVSALLAVGLFLFEMESWEKLHAESARANNIVYHPFPDGREAPWVQWIGVSSIPLYFEGVVTMVMGRYG